LSNYSPPGHVIARAQPEAISNAGLETASPPARRDMGDKVNSYTPLFLDFVHFYKRMGRHKLTVLR
jgi:hypothetical protein